MILKHAITEGVMENISDQSIDLIIVMGRTGVLWIAAVGGILSMYFGWKLYLQGLQSPVTAELSSPEAWKFKMSAFGPGVFFALFGMGILVFLVRQPVVIEDPVYVEEVGSEAQPERVPTSLLISGDPDHLVPVVSLVSQANSGQSGDFSQPSTRKPVSRRCLVAQRRRLYATGSSPLAISDIERDVPVAIQLLTSMEGGDLSAKERLALERSRETLGQILTFTLEEEVEF